jgi:hypothetical protein
MGGRVTRRPQRPSLHQRAPHGAPPKPVAGAIPGCGPGVARCRSASRCRKCRISRSATPSGTEPAVLRSATPMGPVRASQRRHAPRTAQQDQQHCGEERRHRGPVQCPLDRATYHGKHVDQLIVGRRVTTSAASASKPAASDPTSATRALMGGPGILTFEDCDEPPRAPIEFGRPIAIRTTHRPSRGWSRSGDDGWRGRACSWLIRSITREQATPVLVAPTSTGATGPTLNWPRHNHVDFRHKALHLRPDVAIGGEGQP